MNIFITPCSDGWGSYKSQINGTCPDCGVETVDGVAACGCNYSPVECKLAEVLHAINHVKK